MSVTAGYQISGLNPSTVGSATVASGTSPLYFPAPSGKLPQTTIANPLNLSGQSTTPNGNSVAVGNYPLSASGQLVVPGNSVLNGQDFVVKAVGDFQVGPGGACPVVKIDLVANAAPFSTGFPTAGSINQSPSWQVIATTGSLSFQNNDLVYYPWMIEAHLFGTTKSGILSGWQVISVDNTAVQSVSGTVSGATCSVSLPVPLTNTISGLDFSQSYGVFGLAVRVTFSVSEAGNIANMYKFQLQS